MQKKQQQQQTLAEGADARYGEKKKKEMGKTVHRILFHCHRAIAAHRTSTVRIPNVLQSDETMQDTVAWYCAGITF